LTPKLAVTQLQGDFYIGLRSLIEVDLYRAKVKSVVRQLSATKSFLTRKLIINFLVELSNDAWPNFGIICFDIESKLSGELLVQQRRNNITISTTLQSHFTGDGSLNSSRRSKLPHLEFPPFVKIMQTGRTSTRCFQLW